jgi:ADP-ribose pyrophosphatase
MKVPEEAIKKFSGVIFDTYQWEQKMFDGSTETFEMLKKSDTVQVIATQGDKIFLSSESQPTKKDFVTFFGGRIDKGEKPLEAAKRELLEESGMESDNWELFKKQSPYNKIEWTEYVFIAKNCKKTSEQKLDSGEKIEVLELSFDEFFEKVLSDNFRSILFKIDLLKMKIDGSIEDFKKKITD